MGLASSLQFFKKILLKNLRYDMCIEFNYPKTLSKKPNKHKTPIYDKSIKDMGRSNYYVCWSERNPRRL